MGFEFVGPQNSASSCCNPAPGTTTPDIAPYVVSLNSLSGILTLGDTGAITWTSVGGTLYASLSASAGLGSVTSVGLTSTSLTVTGSPITTLGSFTVNLTGATASIQNLVTAADKMIYTTASNTYAVTGLSALSRLLLAETTAANWRDDLGVIIGSDVQAWSADLDSFVTNVAWSPGPTMVITGRLDVSSDVTVGGVFSTSSTSTFGGNVDFGTHNLSNITSVTAVSFTGDGSGLTNLDMGDVTTGTLVAARGGTGNSSYAIGDILYASGATTLSKLADVAAGAYLRSGGVTTAPVWSSITLPNSLATGDVLYASSTTAVSRLADVATGNALISGGIGVAPSWGKITTSHTTGIAASGTNSDITTMTALSIVNSGVQFNSSVALGGDLQDAANNSASGLLTGTGSATLWSTQIDIDTMNLASYLTMAGTVTAGGTTGARTINKPIGSVNFAAAATSLVVTNSLCTASSIITATVGTNDVTMKSVAVVAGAGFFTLYANAGATAETRVNFQLLNPT